MGIVGLDEQTITQHIRTKGSDEKRLEQMQFRGLQILSYDR